MQPLWRLPEDGASPSPEAGPAPAPSAENGEAKQDSGARDAAPASAAAGADDLDRILALAEEDDDLSSMFDAASARLRQMTFDEPSTERGRGEAAPPAPAAAGESREQTGGAASAADLQETFRARLRASAERAAEEMGGAAEERVSESFLLNSQGGSLLGPDTLFQPEGG